MLLIQRLLIIVWGRSVLPDWVRLRRAAWGLDAEGAILDHFGPKLASFVAGHLKSAGDLPATGMAVQSLAQNADAKLVGRESEGLAVIKAECVSHDSRVGVEALASCPQIIPPWPALRNPRQPMPFGLRSD